MSMASTIADIIAELQSQIGTEELWRENHRRDGRDEAVKRSAERITKLRRWIAVLEVAQLGASDHDEAEGKKVEGCAEAA